MFFLCLLDIRLWNPDFLTEFELALGSSNLLCGWHSVAVPMAVLCNLTVTAFTGSFLYCVLMDRYILVLCSTNGFPGMLFITGVPGFL